MRRTRCAECKDLRAVVGVDGARLRLECGHAIEPPVAAQQAAAARTNYKRGAAMEELAAHARDICRSFNIDLVENPDLPLERSVADTANGIVYVPPITSHTVYAAVLHEAGHCLAALGALEVREEMVVKFGPVKLVMTRTNPRRLLTAEAAAWEWARHHALDWTAEMEAAAAKYLGDYERDCRMAIAAEERAAEDRRRAAHEATLRSLNRQTLSDFIKNRRKP